MVRDITPTRSIGAKPRQSFKLPAVRVVSSTAIAQKPPAALGKLSVPAVAVGAAGVFSHTVYGAGTEPLRMRPGIRELMTVTALLAAMGGLYACGTAKPTGPQLALATGSVTITTPILTPLLGRDTRKLGLSALYTEEKLRAALNKPNLGLSRASVDLLSAALTLKLAGPKLSETETTQTAVDAMGTSTSSSKGENSRSRATPAEPAAPAAPEAAAGSTDAAALAKLIDILGRQTDAGFQLPPAEEMTLIASLRTYAIALDDYYNATVFDPLASGNAALVAKLSRSQRQQTCSESRRDTVNEQLDTVTTALAAGKSGKWGPDAVALMGPDEASQSRARALLAAGVETLSWDGIEQRVKVLSSERDRLDQAVKQSKEEVGRLQKKLNEQLEKSAAFAASSEASRKTISVPYRAVFRVAATPGWYAQLKQYDGVVDVRFPDGWQVVGAVPAQTTQTLDEFQSAFSKFAGALEVGGSIKSIAAGAALKNIQAAAERLQGLRSNSRFQTEVVGDGKTLRLRFSPSVVPNLSRKLLDDDGLIVTATLLVPVAVPNDGTDLDAANQGQVEAVTSVGRFEPRLKLNDEGQLVAPDLDDRVALPAESSGQLRVFRPPAFTFPPAQLAFVAEETVGFHYLNDSKNRTEALVVVGMNANESCADIELTWLGDVQKLNKDGKKDNAQSIRMTEGEVQVLRFALPANLWSIEMKDGKEVKREGRASPLVLVGRSGGESATINLNLGPVLATKVVAASGAQANSDTTKGEAEKKSEPKLSVDRGGLKLELPIDKLNPQVVELLKNAFAERVQIVVPDLKIAAPSGPATDAGKDTGGGGAAGGSKGAGG